MSIVTPDRDFSRRAKKVWDLTYSEIRAIPLGGKAAPEFRNEPAPTLDEVLDIVWSHIGLNIDYERSCGSLEAHARVRKPEPTERTLRRVHAWLGFQHFNFQRFTESRRIFAAALESPFGTAAGIDEQTHAYFAGSVGANRKLMVAFGGLRALRSRAASAMPTSP